jgi:hypothetical protein
MVAISKAQLTVSPDTTICGGQAVQLNATGGTTYSWTPTAGLNSPTSANPIATPATTTTYVVSSPVSSANIAINGDFAQGNTGFTSSYLSEPNYNIQGSGAYFVGQNPNNWNPGMNQLCGPRTSTDTNMLVGNGATTAGVPIWCQTLPVNPNVTYNMEVYLAEMNNQNYPSIQWTVNGVNAGSPTQAFFLFPCRWTRAPATWNSGSNTTATFCLVDPVIAGNGNDFALDDITITPSGTIRDTVVVTVVNSPTVNLGADTAVCNGQPVTFNAGNAGATFLWSDNSAQQTLTVNTSGSYSVTVTNANNCSASDAVSVSDFVLALTTSGVSTTCGLNNGQAVATPTNGNAPFTYLWSNSGNTDTIKNLAGGTYTVTVNDVAGCSATGSAVVNTSGAGTLTITADQLQICASDTAHICAPSGYASYLWNTGSSASCIGVSAAGNYYVTVTDNANCTSTSNHLSVGVYPVPPVSVSVSGDTLRAFNAVSYQWYFNGNEIVSATSDVYIATQSGNYTVQVTDTNGCRALSNQLQVVTAINDLGADVSLDVYPNPNATGNWQLVSGNAFLGKEAEVTDITGKLIYKKRITRNKEQLVMDVPAGVYLMKIVTGEKSYLKKLVKQ